MRLPARTGLAMLEEPAVRALVLHVRAGGWGLVAGSGCVRRTNPQPFRPLGLSSALLAHGGCVTFHACTGGPGTRFLCSEAPSTTLNLWV